MSMSDLKVGALYVVLFIRSSPPIQNDFHWGLYFHTKPKSGTKYHIKQQGLGWIADHGVTRGVFKSFLLVGLVRIANAPIALEAHVDGVIRSYDNQLNNPEQTCRVWLLKVLELLRRPVDGNVVLKCDDLDALEKEIMDWGNRNAQGTHNNEQPRPVYDATAAVL